MLPRLEVESEEESLQCAEHIGFVDPEGQTEPGLGGLWKGKQPMGSLQAQKGGPGNCTFCQ